MSDEARDALEAAIKHHHQAGAFHDAATLAVRSYGPELLGYLSAVLRDNELAADVFGVACEDIWRGLPGFSWASSFRTWAYTLTRHACARALRKPSHQRERRLGTSEAQLLAQELRSTTVPYVRTEVKDGVARLREALPPDDQTLLILRVDRGMSWQDIARVMLEDEAAWGDEQVRLRAAALRKRFERVKQRLRRLAEDAGLLAPEDEP